MKLDRKQPFGTICGDAEGRVYEQNYKFYGADDHEIVEAQKKPAPATVAPKAKTPEPKAKTPVDDQLAAQMGAA